MMDVFGLIYRAVCAYLDGGGAEELEERFRERGCGDSKNEIPLLSNIKPSILSPGRLL
jgi:hypothetical protein